MSELEIPEGWTLQKLDEVVKEKQLGANFRRSLQSSNYETPYLKMNNITNFGKLNLNGITFVNASKEDVEKHRLEKGDFLFNTRNSFELVGKTAVWDGSIKNCIYNLNIMRIRFHKEVLPEYVNYFMLSDFFKKQIKQSKQQTTNVCAIYGKDLFDTKIIYPSLKTQKKIIDKLEYVLGKIEGPKKRILELQKIQKNRDLLENSKMSLLLSACNGILTSTWRKNNPDNDSVLKLLNRIQERRKNKYLKNLQLKKNKQRIIDTSKITIIGKNKSTPSWIDVKLENLVYIAGRIGWKGLKHDEYTIEGPMFLSVHSLNYGEYVDFRHVFHISQERYDESPEIQLKNEDILLAKDGNIGKIGIVNNLPSPATVNSSLLVIRSGECFIPKFLFYFLSGPELQNMAKERTKRNTIPHLFQKDIKNFILSIPPLDEQKEIVARIEQKINDLNKIQIKMNEIEKLKSNITLLLDRSFSSILNNAFSGNLVN